MDQQKHMYCKESIHLTIVSDSPRKFPPTSIGTYPTSVCPPRRITNLVLSQHKLNLASLFAWDSTHTRSVSWQYLEEDVHEGRRIDSSPVAEQAFQDLL